MFLRIVKAVPLALVMLFAYENAFSVTFFSAQNNSLMCNYDEFGVESGEEVTFYAKWCKECTELATKTSTCFLQVGTNGECTYAAICKPGYKDMVNINSANVHCLPEDYEIHYNNLYDGTHTNPATYTIEDEDIVLQPATRTNYQFVGWYSTHNASVFNDPAYLVETIPSGSTGIQNLYAGWQQFGFDINYYLDGGIAEGNPAVYTAQTPTFTLNNPTKSGYDFIGWCDVLTGGADCNDEDAVQTYTINQGSVGNKDLYAKWSLHNYNLTYNFMGGEAVENPATYNVETETFTLVNPTKSGYEFAGWCVNSSSCTDAIPVYTIEKGTTTGDKTLYAKWTPINYTINYTCYQEEYPVKTDNVIFGTTPYTVRDSSICPDKEGYKNLGWSCDKVDNDNNVIGTIDSASLTVASWRYAFNVECSGVMEPIHYVITFDKNGGSQSKESVECIYNTPCDITNNNEIVRQGYKFKGWGTSNNSVTYPKPLNGDNTILVTNLTSRDNTTIKLYAIWENEQIECPDGSYLPARKTECETCKEGYYCPGDSYYYSDNFDQGNKSCATAMGVTKATSDPGIYQVTDCKAFCPSRTGYIVTQTYNYGENASACVYNGTIHYENVTNCQDTAYIYPNNSTVVLCNTAQNQPGRIFKGFMDNNGTEYTYNGSAITVNTANLIPVDNVVTMSGVWQNKQYTLRYNCNTSVRPNPVTFEYSTTIELYDYNNCRNTGNTFGGWTCEGSIKTGETEPTVYEVINNRLVGPDENVTCVANWVPNYYTINYIGGENVTGETPQQTPVVYGTEIKLNKNQFIKRGYKFIGWCSNWNNSTERCNGSTFTDEEIVSNLTQQNQGVVNLTAMWEMENYRITYMINGQSKYIGNPTEYNINTAAFNVNNIDDAGVEFSGWCLNDSNCAEPVRNYVFDVNNLPEELANVVLYAKTAYTPYTITYKDVGEDGQIYIIEGLTPTSYNVSDSVIYPDNVDPEKHHGLEGHHYMFDGWYTDSAFTSAKQTYLNIDDNLNSVELYAKWKDTTSKGNVTFNCPNGSRITNTYYYGTVLTELPNKSDCGITEEDISLVGWTCANIYHAVDSDGITQDGITIKSSRLTCNVALDYSTSTITYVENGGTFASEPQRTYTRIDYVSLPTNVTKDGYDFAGWYDNEDLTGDSIAYIDTGNVGPKTFYAKWTGISIRCAKGKYLRPGDTTCTTPCDEEDKYCEGGTFTYSETETQGKKDCPDEYPNAVAGADSKNKCYTDCLPAEQGYEYVSGWLYYGGRNECVYRPLSSAITYVENGGTFTSEPQRTYTSEEFVSLPTNITKDGYDFAGWYDNEDLTGDSIAYIDTGNVGPKTFWAKWTGMRIRCAKGKYLRPGDTTCTTPCDEANKYCEGGTFTYSETETQGKKDCPDEYPNAVAGADSINKCYKACLPAEQGYEYVSGWLYYDGRDECVYRSLPKTITYVRNGGEWNDGFEPQTTYTSEEYVILPTSLSKSGYNFAGWYDNADLTGNPISYIGIGNQEPKTFYAKWTGISIRCAKGKYLRPGDTTCTTSCDEANVYCEGGTFTYSETEAQGKKDCPDEYPNAVAGADSKNKCYTDCPAKSGYEYVSGWLYYGDRDEECVYRALPISITYVRNGGEWNDGFEPQTTYTSEEFVTLPTSLSKSGYTFDGWYDNAGLTGYPVAYIDTGNVEPKTFYAKWTGISIRCAKGKYLRPGDTTCTTPCDEEGMYCDGGTYHYSETETQGKKTCPDEYPNAVAGADNISKCYTECPEKQGYEYVSGLLYSNRDECEYSANTYRIIYVLNGGDWAPNTNVIEEYVTGTAFTGTLPTPVMTNKTFVNWTDEFGTVVETINTNFGRDITLYANWDKGPCSEGYYFVNGDCSACPAGSTAPAGYATQCECAEYYERDTVTGECKPIEYTITYTGLNGATNPNPTTYTVETVDTLSLVNPGRRAGYSFRNWTRKGKAFTQLRSVLGNVLSNVTVAANWNTSPITCPEGTYLPANEEECIPCEDDYYCPGGIYYYDDEPIGLKKCVEPYSLSPSGAVSEEDCFAPCPDDSDALNITGGIYRNGNNTCSYKYAINYIENGGQIIGDYPQEYEYDSGVIYLPDIEREGFEFKGWYLTADYSGRPVTEIDTSNNRGTITLYAKWGMECLSNVILHIGDDTNVCLKESTSNRPAVAVQVGNKTYYLDMTLDNNKTINIDTTKKLHVEYDGHIYNIYDGFTQ